MSVGLRASPVQNALSCVSVRVKYTCMDCLGPLLIFGATSGSVYVFDVGGDGTRANLRSMCSFSEFNEPIKRIAFAPGSAEAAAAKAFTIPVAVCCAKSVFIVDLGLATATSKPRVIAKFTDTRINGVTDVTVSSRLAWFTFEAL
jgi:hypothetical protein